ncbi:MAG: PspA/IM30 family protein [Pirellulaceae bacterium]|nr:PspA/IM30 family protein [Pirellulaceae bacterium]
MSWLSQFSLVMRSSITSLRETVEDPERMLYQLIIDMENEMDRVRRSVAEAVADEILMRKRLDRERGDAESWSQRAMAAMKRNSEDSARQALELKLAATARADKLAEEHAKQQSEVAKLQSAVRDLEDKIRQAKQKKTMLSARMARASSTQKINEALERTHSQSAFAQFRRFEEKVERQEALGEAYDRMDGKDPDAAELEREMEAMERKEQLAAELAALKAQVVAPASTSE